MKIILIFLFSLPLFVSAKEQLFLKNKLLYFSTNFNELRHSQFEIGFIDNKKAWNYHYHTFVTPLLFQESSYEDYIDNNKPHNHTNIGGLGIKFGGILPIYHWPLYLQLAIGLAKINVQKNPFWGKIEESILRTTRWAFHLGAISRWKQSLIKIEYTFSNKKFVDNQLLFCLGLNF